MTQVQFARNPRNRRGMTLVETTISIVITGFIISFVGYLIFMSSINAYNIHEQVMSQSAASNAAEKLSALLRDSTSFVPFKDDAGVTTLSRVMFTVPPLESPAATETTGVLCYKPGTGDKPGEILYFARHTDVEWGSKNSSGVWVPVIKQPPARRFAGIRLFEMFIESDFSLQFNIGFEYRGFAFVFARPTVPMLGQFTTDVVAKNHYLPYGPNAYDPHPIYEDDYSEKVTTNPVSL